MSVTYALARRRGLLLVLAGIAILSSVVVMPQAQAFASALVTMFRGQRLQVLTTDSKQIHNAYTTVQQMGQLGTLQGKVPDKLNTVASVAAATSLAGFSPAQPQWLPADLSHTVIGARALPPSQLQLTFQKTTADAYFRGIGSTTTLPAQLDGQQLLVHVPGVIVLEYAGSGGRLYVGQAGQLWVESAGSLSVNDVRTYLLQLTSLKPETLAAIRDITNWQTTLPLGVPTDRAGWSSANVSGAFGGNGVVLNDNTGLGSALIWQRADGSQTLGVGGRGFKATELQSVASSLH